MKRTMIAMMLVGGLFAVTMPAQDTRIAARKESQQKRIANGVKSGQLTAGETAHLENKEAKLNKEVRTDRKDNGGNLTNNEKKQVNQQQNKISKDIYKDKHNSAVQ
jgi:type II secretory pathway pseudopilin PulG